MFSRLGVVLFELRLCSYYLHVAVCGLKRIAYPIYVSFRTDIICGRIA